MLNEFGNSFQFFILAALIAVAAAQQSYQAPGYKAPAYEAPAYKAPAYEAPAAYKAESYVCFCLKNLQRDFLQ